MRLLLNLEFDKWVMLPKDANLNLLEGAVFLKETNHAWNEEAKYEVVSSRSFQLKLVPDELIVDRKTAVKQSMEATIVQVEREKHDLETKRLAVVNGGLNEKVSN